MRRIVTVVLLSLLGPGLGQLYNKDYKKGIALLLSSSLLFFLPAIWLIKKVTPFLPDLQKEAIHPEMIQSIAMEAIGKDRHILNLISFIFLALWAYAITQAYFKAKEINASASSEEERGDP